MLNLSRFLARFCFLIAVVLPQLGFGVEFEKNNSFELNTLRGKLSGLKADTSQPFVLLQEEIGLNQSFWVLDLSNGFEKNALEKIENVDDTLSAQWSNGKALFANTKSVIVFDPKTKTYQTFNPSMPTGNVFMAWSSMHDRLIYQTEVLPTTKTPNSEETPPHAVQTGLSLADDESYFISSGFHDESIRFWSLPDGKLQKSLYFGGWFSSTEISSFVTFSDGLIFTSNNKSMHWLPTNAEKSQYSTKPCASQVSLYPIKTKELDVAFYSCSEDDSYGMVSHENNAKKFTLQKLGKAPIKSSLLSAHLIKNSSTALLIFDCGNIRLYDLTNNKLIGDQTIPNVVELAYLEGTGDLVALSSDKSLQVWRLPPQ